jgi:hypothetical protein
VRLWRPGGEPVDHGLQGEGGFGGGSVGQNTVGRQKRQDLIGALAVGKGYRLVRTPGPEQPFRVLQGNLRLAVAFEPGRVCAVMTADCLPVVLADRAGTRVAVAHAGWRGLLGGILEATVAELGVAACELHAWLGPAIGPQAFEVGEEVRAAYASRLPGSTDCFVGNERGRHLADLYRLARLALGAAGVVAVHGGGWCTHRDRERFFSFRRDGVTGRMATLAWLA